MRTPLRIRTAKPLACAILAVTLSPAPAAGTSSPPPDRKAISEVRHGGPGCPSDDSLDAVLSDDGRSLSIFSAQAVAWIGPNTQPSMGETCNVSLSIETDADWQYAVIGITHRGSLVLDPSVSATTTWWSFFQGDPRLPIGHEVTGPVFDADFEHSLWLDESTVPWSSCRARKKLILRKRLALSNARNPEGYGLFASGFDVDQSKLDEAAVTYTLVWRRCGPEPESRD